MNREKEVKAYLEGKLSQAEKLKYEIADEMGVLDKVIKDGWKSLSAKERKTFIISFWNSKHIGDGLHTVAFRTSNGSIVAYNRYSNVSTTKTYSSLNDFFAGEVGSDRYITGYKL